MKHWVLIADAAKCTIYETDETFVSFGEVECVDSEHHFPQAAARAGSGGVHAVAEDHSAPKSAERSRFAHGVAALVDAALGRSEYERLVIAAPPKFLGELRADLSARVNDRLVASIHHDFGKTPAHDLPAAVRRHLPADAGRHM